MIRAAPLMLALGAWVPAGGVLAQTLGQGAPADVPWLRVVGALALCLALAFAAALALRARMGGGPVPAFTLGRLKLPLAPGVIQASGGRRLRLVETVRLSHQVDVCLLSCDGEDLLIAATAQGVVVLRGPGQTPAPAP